MSGNGGSEPPKPPKPKTERDSPESTTARLPEGVDRDPVLTRHPPPHPKAPAVPQAGKTACTHQPEWSASSLPGTPHFHQDSGHSPAASYSARLTAPYGSGEARPTFPPLQEEPNVSAPIDSPFEGYDEGSPSVSTSRNTPGPALERAAEQLFSGGSLHGLHIFPPLQEDSNVSAPIDSPFKGYEEGTPTDCNSRQTPPTTPSGVGQGRTGARHERRGSDPPRYRHSRQDEEGESQEHSSKRKFIRKRYFNPVLT
ncbi:hypothetical protein BDV18DRAFT_122862 [Aspergillus unguis]